MVSRLDRAFMAELLRNPEIAHTLWKYNGLRERLERDETRRESLIAETLECRPERERIYSLVYAFQGGSRNVPGTLREVFAYAKCFPQWQTLVIHREDTETAYARVAGKWVQCRYRQS